jgi:alkylhydroperoxidase family enzyme
VLRYYTTSPLDDREKALFAFIDKVNRTSNQIGPADVAEARRAGWSDEALYDAVTICALFNFYNRWIDATGVHDLPAAAYEQSGRRIAEHGYVPDERGPVD